MFSYIFFIEFDCHNLILHRGEECTDGTIFHDDSSVDDRYIATETLCFLEIVSREDDGDSRSIELAEELIHSHAELDIYSGSWLIEDEYRWIVYEGSSDHQTSFHPS